MKESDLSLRLSEHFDLGEFYVSKLYPHAFDQCSLDLEGTLKLYWLCLFCLEKVRDRFGIVFVDSGYRTPELNELIGGSKTSQHVYFEAADIVCPHAKGDVVYDYLVNRMHWEGEVIYYTKRGHVHVAMPNFEVKADHMIVDS